MKENKLKETLLPLIQKLYHVTELLCKAIFVIMVFAIASEVFGRFVIHKTPKWSEEIGIMCMVWLCFMTAQLAIFKGTHVRMTIINFAISKKAAEILHIGAYVLLLVINIVLFVCGIQVVAQTINNKLPSTQLSMSLMYLPIAIGGFIGIFMVIGRMLKGGWKS